MIIQSPDLERLIAFEQLSWTEENQAKPDELSKRLRNFPNGIFVLSDGDTDVAQVTVSPKSYGAEMMTSFQAMRDLPIDFDSLSLWVTNVAVLPDQQGRGYATQLLTEVLIWAISQGYQDCAAVVTCDGYAKHLISSEVSNIHEYMAKKLNPALKVFERIATRGDWQFEHTAPIANYWPEDVGSAGYGVMVRIKLKS